MAKQKTLIMSEEDLRNMIAFGNRAQMTGVEADTWVALKARLVKAMRSEVTEITPPNAGRK